MAGSSTPRPRTLGLSEEALRTALDGKTLAQVAKDRGKSVSGLVAALVAAENKRIDEAVASGRLTKDQAAGLEAGVPGPPAGARQRRAADPGSLPRPLGIPALARLAARPTSTLRPAASARSPGSGSRLTPGVRRLRPPPRRTTTTTRTRGFSAARTDEMSARPP